MIENPVLTFAVMVLIIIFLVLACVIVYLTTPNKFRFFNMPAAYCHRGFHDDLLPENSLGAFAKSAEHGLGVELLLKDLSTVKGDFSRVVRWAEIANEETLRASL